MKVTIIYDNEAAKEGLEADWGFSCLIEVYERKILFDTGADGTILLSNMGKLGIEPAGIEEVFISHEHWDHIGGLSGVLNINQVKVYIPWSCRKPSGAEDVIRIKEKTKIHDKIFSTGTLNDIEQSLVIKTGDELVVIAGCSHPGVKNILKAASYFGDPRVLIGGLHGFSEFDLVEDLESICPTHCTQFKSEIRSRYPKKYISGGAGKIIEI
jgi:7,8-dihydropterin-6-yl-methyl-4-(beta-D-ribofuranosyl)aminobenzene 5'-phosphate synthase